MFTADWIPLHTRSDSVFRLEKSHVNPLLQYPLKIPRKNTTQPSTKGHFLFEGKKDFK